MTKKHKQMDGAIWIVAIFVVCIMTIYDWLGGPLFWTLTLGLVAVVVYRKLKPNRRTTSITTKSNVPARQRTPASIAKTSPSTPPADPYDEFVATMRMHMEAGNWDAARGLLRSIAWGTHRTSTDEFKGKLKELIAEFARRDPLFNQIVPMVTAHIHENPGCIQSALMKQFPHLDSEDFRYVLYYAEVLGRIVRVKKGSSYALYLPGSAPQQLVTPPISIAEKAFLQEMQTKTAVVLPINDYWRNRLAEPEQVLKRLASQGHFRRATLAETLERLTKPQLTAALKQSGLSTTGNKAELIQRLCDHAPESAEILVSDLDVYIPT